MKTRHLFTVALAAFAFAACSQDDDITSNPEPKPGEKGALVESISINFGEGIQKPGTRTYGPDQKGLGTEGMIYEAFIFAKEANPLHDRALDGDWTVIRITRSDAGLAQEVGGINPEAVAKADLKNAVNEGSDKDKEWLVKNVAKFNGVRQGDYVYVIANDPNLTLAQAAAMAHQGDKSEGEIKEYTLNISKDYLNKLTYYPETGKDAKEKEPNGRFVMAGRELIPVSPTIPSNGNIDLTIGLDRELSKVNFTALVSTDPADLAYNKIEFQKGDGIVVARIARKTSMFTEQTGDWYVPATTCVEDWPINDHSFNADGVYSSFCDATFDGSKVFDGEAVAPITNWITGTTIPAGFNTTNPATNISEYRYSWKVNGAPGAKNKPIYIDAASNGKLVSPMFYVTPNYSNNTNSVTVICTQATYVDRGVFANSNMIDEYVDAALDETADDIVVFTLAEAQKVDPAATDPILAENPLKYKSASASTSDLDDIAAKMKVAIKNWGIRMFTVADDYDAAVAALSTADKAIWEATTSPTFGEYQSMMDRFYVAVLLQQRVANKGAEVAGSKVSEATKADFGNGIPTGKKGFYTNADTDSLLLGYGVIDGEKVIPAFYYSPDMSLGDAQHMTCEAFYGTSLTGGKTGAQVRAAYFADIAAYEYFKGQKLYYRADVANYVAGVSNKITERNMYYVSTGTIQSLGAKSIHDAIYSDQNTMSVNVYVKNWKFSQNDIPM